MTTKAVAKVLGLRSSQTDLIDITRKGLPARAAEKLAQTAALSVEQLAAALGVSSRTLARKKTKRLSFVESDRAVRLARVMALALEIYDDDEKAAAGWLHQPIIALGGKAPVDFLDTDIGLRRLEQLLLRLDYGGIS